jgi:cbb3-type cytochrome oxidase maturation protein
MDILFLLIPMSSVLVLGIVGVFAWALHRGQFEDIDFEGERILLDESQAGAVSRNQESTRFEQEVSQWQR